MEQLDARNLAERLRWEQQQYWMHLEAQSPLEKYPAKQHARHVQEKLGVSEGLIYLAGAGNRMVEDSDRPLPYRQKRYFYYLSGVNEADCHLTYDIQHDKLVLFLPRVNPARVVYDGRTIPTPAEALDRYDIDQVFHADELETFVKEWTKYYSGTLYLLHESQSPLKSLKNETVDYTTLQPVMDFCRMIKDDHEIKMIRRANDISSHAHKEVLAHIAKFKNEAQVEGLFLDFCISKQAKEQAYSPIAGSGPNAATLHYIANNEDFEDRQLMCLDAACEWECYAADITRTFPLSGVWPSKEAKDIYAVVLRMQENCIERVKPGVRYLDLHILAHQIAVDGLLNLGLLYNGTKEEILKAGTSRAFFPHGLGHHVGLEVHDVGQSELMSMEFRHNYQEGRSIYPDNYHAPVWDASTCLAPTDPESPHLEEGMVVTIEPGIYFNTYLLSTQYLQHPVHQKYINKSVLKRYLPVGGVRLEDNILVTSKGYENLTTAPKGEEMLQIIRSGNANWPASNEGGSKPASKRYTWADFDIPSDIERSSRYSKASTTDDNVQHWKDTKIVRCRSPEPMEPVISELPAPTTMCGSNDAAFQHTILSSVQGQRSITGSRQKSTSSIPPCPKCTVLLQAVERLRRNLSGSEQASVECSGPQLVPAASRTSSASVRKLRSATSFPALNNRSMVPPRILPNIRSPYSSSADLPETSPRDALQDKITVLEDKIRTLERKLIPGANRPYLAERRSSRAPSVPTPSSREISQPNKRMSQIPCLPCQKFGFTCEQTQDKSVCIACGQGGRACIYPRQSHQQVPAIREAHAFSSIRPRQSMPILQSRTPMEPQQYQFQPSIQNRRSVTFDARPRESELSQREAPDYVRPSQHSLQDYNVQLEILERQNKARTHAYGPSTNAEVSTFMKKYGFERPPPIPTTLSSSRSREEVTTCDSKPPPGTTATQKMPDINAWHPRLPGQPPATAGSATPYSLPSIQPVRNNRKSQLYTYCGGPIDLSSTQTATAPPRGMSYRPTQVDVERKNQHDGRPDGLDREMEQMKNAMDGLWR